MIEIYLRKACPYCIKVLEGAERLGLSEGKDYITVDAPPGSPGRDVVLKVGGKPQVPFLIHDDVFMYESDDILAYLQTLRQ